MPGKPGRPPLDRSLSDHGKKRKPLTDEGSIDSKIACISRPVDEDIESKKNFKKKGFSWNQYLSEVSGIAAPSKLFKNVSILSGEQLCELFNVF